MATAPTPASGQNFRLAMIQLAAAGDGTDKAANLAHAREMIAEAVKGGKEGRKPDVVVLPEIFNSPYATNMFRKYAERIGWTPETKETFDVAKTESESIRLLSSIPELSEDDKVYNSSPTFDKEGNLVAVHRKVHLFDISIPNGITFKESETLTGGDWQTLIETEYGKIGVGICYDVRFPELAIIAARKGAVAMIYPAAFNLSTGPLHWDLVQRARAVDNQIFVGMCSPARATSGDGYKAWGHSSVYDPMGKCLEQLDEKEGILFADIDIASLNSARAGIPVTVQRRFDVYADVSKLSPR
ncbi:Omega-amidase nit3 [Rhodotorula sphaerocarpa]